MLEDTQFGVYYGDVNYDGTGVFSLVLSDARCYQDELNKPYMDSEGDMLVLQLRTDLLAEDQEIMLPAGTYPVSSNPEEVGVIDASASYVTRFVGSTQSKWAIESGNLTITVDEAGEYSISTNDLVLVKGDRREQVSYTCKSKLHFSDYKVLAPSMTTISDDIVDMPFPDVDFIYNGDLYGNGTGNFVVNLSTKGFVIDGEMMDVPGIYITLTFFSRLYSGNSEPVLEEGQYIVSTATSSTLFQRWSMMPGMYLETTPFGSYLLQLAENGESAMEFISSGVVNVEYEGEDEEVEAAATKAAKARVCKLTYEFKTSSRVISGVWKGEVIVDNQAETSNESFLTTLDHDVECDMSKVTGGSLRKIETLHRDNVEEEWDYDIAEAWQLYLQPRDWTPEEYAIPWLQDNDGNGISDRLDAYCADGDVMVLEFILPLGSQGIIAPELNKTYTYTMQPNLSVEDANYELYVSRMGRPADEVFDSYYAEQYPAWASYLGIESYDRSNARRGFTWSEDGFRGNWYMHYETGKHFNLDGHAPAVNGWVKVTRTGEDTYDFEWDFIDDNPGTPNQITGSIENCKVTIQK